MSTVRKSADTVAEGLIYININCGCDKLINCESNIYWQNKNKNICRTKNWSCQKYIYIYER